MSIKKDLTGKRFGKLKVLCEYSERAKDKHNSYQWVCQCDCGNEVIVIASYLTSGHKTSCGCLRWTGDGIKTHGLSDSRIIQTYSNMKRRCDNPKNNSYKYYGGKGITYCEKWKTFDGFLDDMYDTYKDGLTIERLDNSKNYCKENCTWATMKQQENHTGHNHKVEYQGETLNIIQLVERTGTDYDLVKNRINRGWSVEDALKPAKTDEEIEYKGITKTVTEFGKTYGLTYHQLKKRLMRGWTIERALETPLRGRK